MASDNFEIPEYMKALFDKEIRDSIASESFFNLHELALFKWHLDETEGLHKRMHDEELAYIKKQYDDGRDLVNDSGMLPVEYFYRRIRYSDVIYLVSLLETALEGTCGRLRQLLPEASVPFDLSEIKGEKWHASRMFLERYGTFTRPERLWKPINRLIILRNALVHDNGDTDMLKEDQKNALSRCKGLSVTGGQIEVRFEYVENLVQDLEAIIKYYEEGVNRAIAAATEK